MIEKIKNDLGSSHFYFIRWDDGDVYNLFHDEIASGSVPGTIFQTNDQKEKAVSEFGNTFDRVRVILHRSNKNVGKSSNDEALKVTGYLRHHGKWEKAPTQIIPVRDKLFSRHGGLIETDILSDKKVFILGLGSGGSHILTELSKTGISHFYLMDDDRHKIGNVNRHAAGISHFGRYKTKIGVDLVKERNPYAKVQTYEEKASWNNIDKLRMIIRKADEVICATDNKSSKLISNRLCVEENKPCIFAGAFRRAHGGQILVVQPFVSLCYQCFCMLLPEKENDQEISSQEHAESLAYTDRPVPIEPGLSIDIAPISLMVVKIVIQHLLKGKETTLRSLDDDLKAPFLFWLNRREKGTQYEKLQPLGFNFNGITILRWYGVDMKKHPDCPVCGHEENLFSKYL